MENEREIRQRHNYCSFILKFEDKLIVPYLQPCREWMAKYMKFLEDLETEKIEKAEKEVVEQEWKIEEKKRRNRMFINSGGHVVGLLLRKF